MGTRKAALAALGFAILAVAVASLFVRGRPVTSLTTLVLAAGAPYAAFASLLVVTWAIVRRSGVWSVAALSVAVAVLGVQVSWYHLGDLHSAPHDDAGSKEIRLISANLRNGEADALAVVALAVEDADVMTVSELTPEAVQRLSRAGIGRTFPYSRLIPAPLAGGVGIWSRYPVEPVALPESRAATVLAVLLDVPGLRRKPLLAGVHVKSPLALAEDTVDDWRNGMTYLKAQYESFATIVGSAAVITAGDFNSTPDMRQFRDLLANGYRDAVQQLGAGFGPTFPADRWYPPLITIDHVLTRNSAASSITTVRIAGSDHRGLLATIRVPVDG